MFRGSFRGKRKSAPAAAIRFRFTSGTPKTAVRDATTRSQASTISVPPASAGPSTAAMMGFVRVALHEAREAAALGHHAARIDAHLLQVGAGAEDVALAGPGAGEDPDPRLVVGLELVDGLLEALRDRGVDGVARVGTVDGDDGDVAFFAVLDHGAAP